MKDGKKCIIRQEDVLAVYPLIYKMAQSTFYKLPKHVQVYLSLEDLIQEGTNFAVERLGVRYYNKAGKKGAASFFTYFYCCLDRHFKKRLTEIYADKRKALAVYSMDSSLVNDSTGRSVPLIERLKKRIDSNNYGEDAIIRRIDAERTFIKMYGKASPRLRKYLIRWILQPTDTKFKLYGNKFIKAADEFRLIEIPYSIMCETCRCLWRDADARVAVCRKIIRSYQTPTKKSEPLPFREDELRSVAFYA